MYYGVNKRKCWKCREIKGIYLFHKEFNRPGGYSYKCKTCANQESRQYRLSHKEYFHKYRLEHKEKILSQIYEWGRKNPLKRQVYSMIKYLVKSKKLIPQPCATCKKLPVEAHHNSYSRPLDVVWLCKIHHSDVRRNGHFYYGT